LAVLGFALALALASAAGARVASHAAFSNATDLATGFPTCPNPGGGRLTTGPYGGTSDANYVYIVDICNGTTYRVALSGGDVMSGLSADNGFDLSVDYHMGHYYGTASGREGAPAGLYLMNPTTLARGTELYGSFPGCPRQVIGDPLSSTLYVSGCDEISKVVNPNGAHPTVTPFAKGNFYGLGFAPNGSVLYAADISTGQLLGFNRSGKQVLALNLLSHHPQGLAVAPAGTRIGGVNLSGDVFVNDNDARQRGPRRRRFGRRHWRRRWLRRLLRLQAPPRPREAKSLRHASLAPETKEIASQFSPSAVRPAGSAHTANASSPGLRQALAPERRDER
jgi:hypothetical protein